MLQVKVKTDWLLSALSPFSTSRKMLPQLIVHENTVSVQHFYDSFVGMRSISKHLPSADNMSFELSETVQRFLQCCSSFNDVCFELDGSKLTITIQSSCSALQYKVPYVKLTEKLDMPNNSDQAIEVMIPSQEWLNIWKTIPVRGAMTIECTARKQAITMKHSKGRWCGGVHAQAAPSRSVSFECDSRVAKAVFAESATSATFSSLIFTSNILCWKVDDVTVFLAPRVE